MYSIGEFAFDEASGEVSRGDKLSRLSPKAAGVLKCLIDQPHEIVNRQKLHDVVWANSIVTDAQISKAVNELRTAFGDTNEPRRYIETLPKRGYRLVAAVSAAEPSPSTAVPPPSEGKRPWAKWMATVGALCAALALLVYMTVVLPLQTETAIPPEIVADGEKELHGSTPLAELPMTSIAVMPFKSLSDDEKYGWVRQGTQEALIEALSRTEEFRIPGTRNTELIADQQLTVAELGQRLHVGMLIDGTVMVVDDALRINVQLVQVASGELVWTRQIDAPVADLFDIQRDLAIEIAESIRAELGLEPFKSSMKLARYQTTSLEAYELFLEAERLVSSLLGIVFPRNREQAISLLNRALAADPDYRLAQVRKGYLQLWNGELAQAKLLGEAALESDTPAAAHQLLGDIAAREMRWEESLTHYELATELEPWNGELHAHYSQILLRVFRHNEALQHARLATELDPQDRLIRFLRAVAEMHAGRYQASATQFYILMELGGNPVLAKQIFARVLYLLGNDAEAAALMLDNRTSNVAGWMNLLANRQFRIYLQDGEYGQAIQWILPNLDCSSSGETANIAAQWYATFGQREALFECLRVAPLNAAYGPSIRVFDYRYKPYWYDQQMIDLLEETGLDAYLPPSDPDAGVQLISE